MVIWVVTISQILDGQLREKNPAFHAQILAYPASRFLGSSQIPNPVKILSVFPIPASYFGQITLPEPRRT